MSDDIVTIIPAPTDTWLPAVGSDELRTISRGGKKRNGFHIVHRRVAYLALVETTGIIDGGERRVEWCDHEGNYLDKEYSPSETCPERDIENNGAWSCVGHWEWQQEDDDEPVEATS